MLSFLLNDSCPSLTGNNGADKNTKRLGGPEVQLEVLEVGQAVGQDLEFLLGVLGVHFKSSLPKIAKNKTICR